MASQVMENSFTKNERSADGISVSRERSEDVPPNLWDSLESDTESMLQEKSYRRQLQKCISDEAGDKSPFGAKPHNVYEKVDSESNQQENIYSSSESERTLSATQAAVTGRREMQSKNNNLTRQSPRGDEYADLRYDPDWRRNLPGAQFLCKDQMSLSLDSCAESEDMTARESCDDVVVSHPVEVDIVQPRPFSFHLHPQQGQFSHEDTTLSLPQSFCSSSESTQHFNLDRAVKVSYSDHQSTAEVLPSSSTQQRQQKESNKQYNGEERSISTDKLNSVATHSRKARQTRPTVDIVERNKATLGVKSHQQGSYLKAYDQKGWRTEDAHQPTEPAVDTGNTDIQGSPDNALDPELMWIQKTQKLKIHKEGSDRPRPKIHRSGPGAHVRHPVERRTSRRGQQVPTPAENRMLIPPDPTSISDLPRHQPFPGAPKVHLNINANALAKPAEPLLSGQLHEQVFSFAPPHLTQWRIRPDGYTLPSINPASDAVDLMGSAPQVSVSRTKPGNHHMDRNHLQGTGRRLDDEPGLTEGTTVINNNSIRASPKWPAFEETSNIIAPTVMLFNEESGLSDYVLTMYNGAYAVLPPIGGPTDSDMVPCNAGPALNTIPRSNSEGYLAQLEKQRQFKPQTTYKVYTLKDYRTLNQEVKLGGLGPSYTVTEEVAKKIKRQKLYSNVIREQNKKISTIPFLPDRNPLGSGNKGDIPRNKALEYAKTIMKPKAPQQWRERPQEKHEKALEHPAILQLGLDLSQLAALDMLRKRHEEEKQAVAHFTSHHTNSSAPSVNTH
ncbi:jhy protein homolog [Electrophorus electricus]|uniref:jhy protein homolog n=1 Tax=Electrophorus electricus TaxID=8005 RepID=UPI0015D0BAFF|nr:jhy protein homolog [Electrophorus electricus]